MEDIMKTFKQVMNQLERIHTLYVKGFGTEKMIRKCEDIFFGYKDIGLQF